MDNIAQQLKNELPDLRENEILAPYTTFKIGGPAKLFFAAKSNEDIIKAIKLARDLNIKYFILGKGSNILVSDSGFDGLVIKMENQNFEIKDNIIIAESGLPLQKLLGEIIKHNLSGLEFVVGIPGTVGGAVAGNVGTTKEWIGSKIKKVNILDFENNVKEIPKSQCDFSYRCSKFKNNDKDIILSAEFKLDKSTQDKIQKLISKYLENRINQPTKQPNAGSIFKNPPEKAAWKLIDEAGLRGKKIGGAQISEKHSNFIVNTGNAKADDVAILISFIKQQVRDKLGIQLQEEIKYIGF